MATSIQKVYIADGLVDDCEELIQRCLQTQTLNFSTFCNHWKEMNFAYIFQCRSSGAELAEFSEEAIHIAKRYMLANTSNYEESVAGLFLVYALLKLQPFAQFAPLRITPQDIDAIYCLKDVARRQGRTDVLYILGKVLIEGPCQLHAGDREYGMDKAVRKYCQVTTSIDAMGARAKGVFYRQNEELDLLRELASLGRRYTRAKGMIYGNKRPDKTLSYLDEHLPSEMAASLKQLIVGNTPTAAKPEEDAVHSLKRRAMKEAVGGMRHLTGVHERKRPTATTCPLQPPEKTKGPKMKQRNKKIPITQGDNISLDEIEICLSDEPTTSKNTKGKRKVIKNKKEPKRRAKKQIEESSDDDHFSIASSDNSDWMEQDEEENLSSLKTIDEYIHKLNEKQIKKAKKKPEQVEIEIDISKPKAPRKRKQIKVENVKKETKDKKTTKRKAPVKKTVVENTVRKTEETEKSTEVKKAAKPARSYQPRNKPK